MNVTAEARWNQRRFIAVVVALSGLALPVTGLADHVAAGAGDPAGWSIVHITLGSVFVGFAVWHCCLNRRALLRHLHGAAASRALAGHEALAAAVLVGGLLVLTVLHALVGS